MMTMMMMMMMMMMTMMRLAFFEMHIPHFGRAELVSFSCGCGYKYTKVRTALGAPPGPNGRTLALAVRGPSDLSRQVVVSDDAVVRCPALELEMQLAGRYTTVEAARAAGILTVTRRG
jgi:C4-type Zn-finger protein